MYSNMYPVVAVQWTSTPTSSVFDNNIRVRDGNKKNTAHDTSRPPRTSTPLLDPDHSSTEHYSDSVSEFFYQSWKNELNSDLSDKPKCDCNASPNPPSATVQNINYYIINNNIQPIMYTTQMVFLDTLMPQPRVMYYPAVGYRQDGTYGVLPNAWYYCYT